MGHLGWYQRGKQLRTAWGLGHVNAVLVKNHTTSMAVISCLLPLHGLRKGGVRRPE